MREHELTGKKTQLNPEKISKQRVKRVPTWKKLLSASITDVETLAKACKYKIDKEKLKKVIERYPMRINPYYLSLIEDVNDPIWKQCMPDEKEITNQEGYEDPLLEEKYSPVPGITHRYPDRVLFLVSNQCAMYCRFCTRKRRVGHPFKRITREQIMRGINYISKHKEIRDVLLSGGDPLLLSDSNIEFILKELRKIQHVEIIRIGTRVPCTLPQRITPELCNVLKKYHPVYVNTHFEHPREITDQVKTACEMLAEAGIPIGNHSIVLNGINDDTKVMTELMRKLLTIRVRPYYIYIADIIKGSAHFRVKLCDAKNIMENMIGHISGLAVPKLILDLTGGGGKIPLSPQYELSEDKANFKFRNYENRTFKYPKLKED